MKKCRLCGLEKDFLEFGIDKHEKDGRNARCRACINKIKRNKNFVAIIDGKKKCMHCKIEKHVSEFNKHKVCYDGLHVWCRECHRKKGREYRSKNPKNWERQRQKNFINWRQSLGIDPDIKIRNKSGEGHISRYGYLSFRKKGHPCADKNGRVQASHLVIYEETGKVIKKGETVHHKNGIRLDNRFENLEVWHSGHPQGQRLEDKIAWCIELLQEYGYGIIKPINGNKS